MTSLLFGTRPNVCMPCFAQLVGFSPGAFQFRWKPGTLSMKLHKLALINAMPSNGPNPSSRLTQSHGDAPAPANSPLDRQQPAIPRLALSVVADFQSWSDQDSPPARDAYSASADINQMVEEYLARRRFRHLRAKQLHLQQMLQVSPRFSREALSSLVWLFGWSRRLSILTPFPFSHPIRPRQRAPDSFSSLARLRQLSECGFTTES